MLTLTVDTAAILDLANELQAMGLKMPAAQAAAINRVAERVRSRIIPTLAAQTGLNRKIITKAVKMRRATPQHPEAVLYTRGGEISLRYYGAREEGGGVVANVAGEREFFQGAFRRSGPKGGRFVVAKLNHQTFVNAAPGGMWGSRAKAAGVRPIIKKVKSGMFIPAQMIRGETAAAFDHITTQDLPREIEQEALKLMPGGKR